MSAPSATVVIATYQRRRLVRRAVDSVLAQTRSDFELVVVDDGSTDGTAESLAGLDPRLVVERRDHRRVAAARNTGVRRGHAPVIAFLDSDDLWLPDHLATVLDMLERHPEAVLASTCQRFVVPGAATTPRTIVRNVFAESLLSNSTGLPTCIAVRRWAFERVGGLDEALPALQDDDLVARLAAVGPFAFLHRRTVIRNDTSGSHGKIRAASGDTLVALERRGLRDAEQLSRTPGQEALSARAMAAGLLARALMALDAGSDGRCRELLARACELEPALHDQAELVSFRIARYLPSVSDRTTYARACRRCADAWPDQAAITPHWLRIQAAIAGARARRPDIVVEVLRRWRPAGAGRLIGRAALRAVRRARDLVESLALSGRARLRGS